MWLRLIRKKRDRVSTTSQRPLQDGLLVVSINILGLKAQISQNLPKYYNLQMWTRIQYLRLNYNTEWQSFHRFICPPSHSIVGIRKLAWTSIIAIFIAFFFIKDIYLKEILNFMRAGAVWFISLSVVPSEWAVAQLPTQYLSCWTEEKDGGLTSSLVYVMSVSKCFL